MSRLSKVISSMPKMCEKKAQTYPKKIWSEEAIRIIIRYNFERGLTVRECLDEMDPHFSYETLSENNKLIRIYKIYRDLLHGIYTYVGNYTQPASPLENYRARLRALELLDKCWESECDGEDESTDADERTDDNDADHSETSGDGD